MVCDKLQFYFQTHKYADIIGKSQSEGVNLVGYNQSMCSLMKKGKSCVKNFETIDWLLNFLSIN
jgi:hypothetical protein